MLGIKTKIKNHFDSYLNLVKSPKKSPFFIENLILALKFGKQLKKESTKYDIQLPLSKKVNRYAALAIKILANYMPNNLGNWSINKPHSLSTHLEKKVVEIIKNYYQCSAEINGHLTSGSTEGNIYAAWIGRNYLMKKLKLNSTEKIAFLQSSLGHYSLNKAADLINIKNEELAIDAINWNIDLEYLNKTLEKFFQKGFRGFLIPLTIGYTVTGTEDNIEKICKIAEKFKKIHQEVDFFIWIDAAFSGISKIFTTKNFRPFENRSVQLITTDFHKLLAIPYSAGLTLYRKGLTNFIKRDMPYIGLEDTTLLGSRSGMSAIVTWFTLINLNEKKLKNTFKQAIAKKESFLKELMLQNLKLKVIDNQNSIQACLVLQNQEAEKFLLEHYNLENLKYKLLFSNGHKNLKVVKLYFFPRF